MKVYIIHGWTYTLDAWQEFCAQLGLHSIDPVQLKVPGLTEPSDKVWDMDGYVEWLKQQLAGVEQPIVIGHSNGGRIALNFASSYPDIIKQLILIDSAGIYHGDLASRLKRGGFKVIAKLGKPLAYIPLVKKVFYKLIGAKDYYRAPDNMKQTMRNMLAADKLLTLEKVTTPVQLIWGSADRSTPLTDAYEMQRRLPNAKLRIINGAGHSPHTTNTAEMVEIILPIVERLS